jgi:uncharacterized protein (DUF1501 family)
MVGLGLRGAGPLFLRRAAWAAPSNATSRRPVLVTIFQRGAMDGVAAVAPIAPELRGPLGQMRPNLAMSAASSAGEDRLLDLGVGFGVHPALAGFLPLWQDGKLGIVHAVGSPDPTRSHFDAQDYMETATPGRKSTRDGWLDRVVGELGHERTEPPSALRAVALTDALPRSLQGNAGGVAIASLEEFQLGAAASSSGRRQEGGVRRRRARTMPRAAEDQGDDRVQRGFEALYGATEAGSLQEAGAETFEAMEALAGLDPSRYRPRAGVEYPRSSLGEALRQVAQMVKGDVGLEVAFAESGGWDTHVRQGAGEGSFARRAADLADSIAAFWRDLGAARSHVVLLTMTEFGRTVAENGSAGTDHGRASCMFVLGDRVAGGQVHGSWPGLEREQLEDGRDLTVATDFRSVFGEVAAAHLGVADLERIFPGFGGERLPLFRA